MQCRLVKGRRLRLRSAGQAWTVRLSGVEALVKGTTGREDVAHTLI
jgi:hypothetical protein